MERLEDVIAYLKNNIKDLDEMKLHKLLYFIQRESFAVNGDILFNSEFVAWKYGPVCIEARNKFKDKLIFEKLSRNNIEIIDNIINEYGKINSWQLSLISHKEDSWKNNVSKSQKISNLEIKKDSEKIRPYCHLWDMYYDEFED